jgi:hypothetical protein
MQNATAPIMATVRVDPEVVGCRTVRANSTTAAVCAVGRSASARSDRDGDLGRRGIHGVCRGRRSDSKPVRWMCSHMSLRDRFDLVVLDWAGTMVDFGCQAPVKALVEAFAAGGVAIEAALARQDMGKSKADHVRSLLQIPVVATAASEVPDQGRR